MRCTGERLIGDVTVLDLVSRTMLGELTTDVTNKINDLTAQGRRAFLLNLAGVSSLDSHGLGDLVGAVEAATRVGGSLKLAQVPERVAYPLRVMNLEDKLEAFDSEEDAIKSFQDS